MEAPRLTGRSGRVVAIVQARTGSQRFPAKMLAPLAGVPLIEWVLIRVRRATTLDGVLMATTTSVNDRALVAVADRLGVSSFRGPEEDVLGRFVGALEGMEADAVVRVCADNPFIDPGEIDRLVRFYRASDADYCFNHVPRAGCEYPDGMGAEIVAARHLRDLEARSSDPMDREHVTWSFWQPGAPWRVAHPEPPEGLRAPGVRFDVDVPSDLDRIEQLLGRFAANRPGVDLLATPSVEFVRFALRESGLDRANP